MAKTTRIYWDACSWIAVINEERAVPQKDGTLENRFSPCESVLNQAKQGEFDIVVSAFTLAEVCQNRVAKTTQKNILPAFLDHSFILVIPVDKDIGLKAQTLQISGIGNLKPQDAVHIASAQRANAKEFHTFDSDLLKLDGIISDDNGNLIKICKPGEGESLGGLFEEKKSPAP